MRKRELTVVLLVFCTLLACSSFAVACTELEARETGHGTQRETGLAGYSNGELQELLRVMAVLSTDREKPLAARMFNLSPYHRVLLLAAFQGGGIEVANRLDESLIDEPDALGFDKNERMRIKKDFDDALFMLSLGRDEVLDQNGNAIEFPHQSVRSEVIATAILSILDNFKNHSSSFVCDALFSTTVCWAIPSDSFKEASYPKLLGHLEQIPDESVRGRIFETLALFLDKQKSTYETFVHDRNKYISHRSAKWLVENGYAKYLPKYVRLTWFLYGDSSEDFDYTVLPIIKIKPKQLLEDLIVTNKPLDSEESQLRWLEKNIDKLKWDEKKEIYIVAEKQ